ncbi:MAG: hypothetical protein HUN05_05650 [Desulfobacter sp.]|nr:MAG: hypothetical protein HUN05_05650 [Desulfobacter sp.]
MEKPILTKINIWLVASLIIGIWDPSQAFAQFPATGSGHIQPALTLTLALALTSLVLFFFYLYQKKKFAQRIVPDPSPGNAGKKKISKPSCPKSTRP